MDDAPRVYDRPKYYEIAFSFRDIPSEVDVMEECIRRFSRIPVKSVLEMASGNSPHLAPLVGRGYRYTGVDRNEAMLEYSARKAKILGAAVRLVRGDLADFKLDEQADFAFIALGSLYVTDPGMIKRHLDSMARALKPGGLYLLDWCLHHVPLLPIFENSWELERDGIKMTVFYRTVTGKAEKHYFRETIRLEVDDHGNQVTCVETGFYWAVYPKEFIQIMGEQGGFEFVGWWNNWSLDRPLDAGGHSPDGPGAISRPITVIRRI
jgi:SAM-dependent methyltransferase